MERFKTELSASQRGRDFISYDIIDNTIHPRPLDKPLATGVRKEHATKIVEALNKAA